MRKLVVIPAHNEEQNIRTVIHSVKRLHPDIKIVVVNDGSTDGTSMAARQTGEALVIDLPFNLGIGGAVQTGYLFAWRSGYDTVIQVDADGQHDPAELYKLIACMEKGEADCCIGSRFARNTDYRQTLFRMLGIRILASIIRWTSGRRFTDPTSGFRAVNRSVIRVFADDYPDDYPEAEAIVILERMGFRVRETAVRMNYRMSGRSSITPFRSVYYMIKVPLAVLMTRIRNVG